MNRSFRSTFRRLAICTAALTGFATAAGAGAAEPAPEPATTNELRFVILPNGKTTVDGIHLFSGEGAEHLSAVLSAETNGAETVVYAKAGQDSTFDDLSAVDAAIVLTDFNIWRAGNRESDPPSPRSVLFDEIHLAFDFEGETPYPVWWPALTIHLGVERILIGGFLFSRDSLGPALERLPDALRRASNLVGEGRRPPVFCLCDNETPLTDLLAVRRTVSDLEYGRFMYSSVPYRFHESRSRSLSERAWDKGNQNGEWWKAAEDEP